jgi:hypothetical protein
MVATETSGSWAPSAELPPPLVGDDQPPDVAPQQVTCASQGNCVVVGVYSESNGSDEQALLAAEADGSWGVNTVTPPSDAQAGEPDTVLYAVACTSSTSCVAGGSYANAPDNFEPLVVSSVAPPTVATTTLPPAVVGSPYSAALKSGGGGGALRWSLRLGSLPAGLTLNSSSGLISGTPTAAGTSKFNVGVSEPDLQPPFQTQSVALSIKVSPQSSSGGGSGNPTSAATAKIAAVKEKRHKVTVTVTCVGAAGERCGGRLALRAVERLSDRRVTAISAAKRRTRTVTLGRTTYAVAAGESAAFTITLNRTARRLLKRHHRFRAALALTPAGSERVAVTETVTLAR